MCTTRVHLPVPREVHRDARGLKEGPQLRVVEVLKGTVAAREDPTGGLRSSHEILPQPIKIRPIGGKMPGGQECEVAVARVFLFCACPVRFRVYGDEMDVAHIP